MKTVQEQKTSNQNEITTVFFKRLEAAEELKVKLCSK
jgi:hypothetical protein